MNTLSRYETIATLRDKAAAMGWHSNDNGNTLRDAGACLTAIIWGAVLTRWALMLIGGA